MISTGAFLSEMDASNKVETTVSKLVSAWEKKNAKVARAGGVSLMALSLAACGSDDDSSTTTTSSSTTTTTTTTVTPLSASLTLASDTITGTSENDTVTGARVDTVSTLSSSDNIDLAGGTGDQLTANLNAATVRPTISNTETVTFTALGNATVDADLITGVTTFAAANSTNTLLVDDIQALPTTISVTNASAAQSFRIKDAQLTGTQAINVSLDGVTAVVNIGGETDTDGDIETFTITASGAPSDLGVGNGMAADATTINVNASANLDLGSTAQFLASTNFDASGSTGNVTAVFATRTAAGETAVSIKGGAGADTYDIGAFTLANYGDITVDMGAGNDTLDMGAAQDTDSGSSFEGGDGTDTLIISGTALTAAEGARISGFENLTIETSITQDADFHDGTTFSTGAVNLTLVLNDLADDSVVNLNHNNTSTTMNRKTDTATDAVTVNIGGTAGGVTATALVFETDYETVTINSQGTAANVVTAIATNVVDNMTFTGATALTLTSANNITGVVDFSAMTAAVTVTVTDTTSQTITLGQAGDTLTATGVVATGQSQIINGGAGNDSITAGIIVDGGSVTFNGDAGSDTLSTAAMTGATGASTAFVNGGAGLDFITLDASAGNSVDVVSTATGVADADEVTAFTTTVDDFDYNGTLLNGSTTTVSVTSNATLAGGLAAGNTSTVYIVTTALTGQAATDMTALVAESTVAGITADYATFEASLATALGTITGLDSILGTTETVLLNIDDGTNSVVLKVTNTDTSTANTLTAAELDLVAVMVGADDLVAGDFI